MTQRNAYPPLFAEAERKAIAARREAAGVGPVRAGAPCVGLALSGGGIRSSTFCLGVLQALARQDLLRRIDYLSTVSGGGYIGAFLGGLYVGPRDPRTAAARRADDVRSRLTASPDDFSVDWLRRNGRYLAPNGAGASWLAGAIFLRNWLSVVFVLVVASTSLALLAEALHLAMNVAREHLPPDGPLLRAWRLVGRDASPLFLLPIAVLASFALPVGIAYWLIPVERTSGIRAVAASLFASSLLAADWALYGPGEGRIRGWLVLTLATIVFFSIVWWGSAMGFRLDTDGKLRHRFSKLLKAALLLALVLAAIALCDALGKALYDYLLRHDPSPFVHAIASFYAAAAAIVVAAQRVLSALGPVKLDRSRVVRPILFAAAAFALILAGGTLVSLGSHAVVWEGRPLGRVDARASTQLAILLAITSVATFVLGRFPVFVNESSLASFYAARLTRAYLGASNDKREDASKGIGDLSAMSGTEPIVGDQITMDRYLPHLSGGPLHLINATINETVDPRVQVKQPDRHGVSLAIGPVGVSVGVRHHAMREPPVDAASPFELKNPEEGTEADARQFSVFPLGTRTKPEALTLGDWVAVSGATVAPGLGARTRIGTSLLLALFNMRLGYWWDSGIDPRSRSVKIRAPARPTTALVALAARALPVYGFLLGELLARFPGTGARHWYLSDGGHFENTGCYELIRRRLPFIVCCDAGADPDYRFDDIANLVRIARVDFGAEISFLEGAELSSCLDEKVRPWVGALEQLGRRGWRDPAPPQTAHAALARIRYTEPAGEGFLLVLKPTLCGGEPQDVRSYGAAHDSFPQESITDQFFDDAQWEAYRRLGEHIGACLFGNTPEGSRWFSEEGAGRGAILTGPST
jgi:hypothetical protein